MHTRRKPSPRHESHLHLNEAMFFLTPVGWVLDQSAATEIRTDIASTCPPDMTAQSDHVRWIEAGRLPNPTPPARTILLHNWSGMYVVRNLNVATKNKLTSAKVTCCDMFLGTWRCGGRWLRLKNEFQWRLYNRQTIMKVLNSSGNRHTSEIIHTYLLNRPRFSTKVWRVVREHLDCSRLVYIYMYS